MKREPRLQFSDADLAEPKLEKPIKRVKKAEAKADKAQAKIPKKTVVKRERGFDPATGMPCGMPPPTLFSLRFTGRCGRARMTM